MRYSGVMTPRRATDRRTTLQKRHDEVIAALVSGSTPAEVATRFKVARSTVTRFIRRYQDTIEALERELHRQVTDFAIASVVNRIEALDDRWKRAQELMAIRAADQRYAFEPGYSTGLMVHKLKAVGSGAGFAYVDEFAVDVALLAEVRAIERAAAEQLAQLPKPGDINLHVGDGGKVLIVTGEPELGF